VNADEIESLVAIAGRLEREIEARGTRRLKAFIIDMNPGARPPKEIEARLVAFAGKAALEQVALTYVPGPTDPMTSALYSISPDTRVKSTVLITRNRRVKEKFINLDSDDLSLARLAGSIDAASTEGK